MMKWEKLVTQDAPSGGAIHRAKVLGGWLIWTTYSHGTNLMFFSDPQHAWDGSTLPG